MDRLADGVAEATVGLMIGSAAVVFLMGFWVFQAITMQQSQPRFQPMGDPIGDIERERSMGRSRAVNEAFHRHLDSGF